MALMTKPRERPARDDSDPGVGVCAGPTLEGRPMRAVIGRVEIKPGRADEALAMIVRGEMIDAKSIVALLRARDFLAAT